MRNLLAILCCLIGIQYNSSAQSTLALQTASINGVTVITPTYSNLFKLLSASTEDFIASVTDLHYTQSKPGEPNTYQATSPGQVYNVDKETKEIDIFFTDNASFARAAKDDLLLRYPDAKHKSMDKGIEAYYFDLHDGSGGYWMLFDLPADGGGGVTLLQLD
ncbi:hypothetical protein [uncultured Mucilaginibacter sp.]|uniref:hypothetical protein n=1 Tax=uncultured Mucilaginibacter sp. TaxID=797541 RepID=UPI0025FC5402|nr:hypothetical protein [uncultured Mucilaginibacter sp.]